MSRKIKLQHYVPRFYLHSFSIHGKEDFLYCFDKSKSSSFVVNIRNIASETYFYDTANEVTQRIEKMFSEAESLFKPVHEKIVLSEDLGSLTSEEKLSLACFVVTQELRTKERRETQKDMIRQLKERLAKEELSKELQERLRLEELETEEGIKAFHLSTLKNAPLYTDIVLQMKWRLFINRTPMPFWSSDHPVNRFNPVDAKPYGNLGLLCRGIEIHFPLSPKLTLSMCDPSMYDLLPSKYEIDDIQNTVFLNWLQVCFSTSYVFSDTDDFSLAKEIVRANPSLRELNRKRVSVD